MPAGDSFSTGVKQARSNSRMVLPSSMPILCRPAMLSWIAARASLLYAFPMSFSFPGTWFIEFQKCPFTNDGGHLFFAVAEINAGCFAERTQLVVFDVGPILLLKSKHQDHADTHFNRHNRAGAPASSFPFSGHPELEDSSDKVCVAFALDRIS